MDERVVIDTDDLRRAARHVQGTKGVVGDVVVDLRKVAAALTERSDVRVNADQIVSMLTRLGSVLAGDHDHLLAEVIAIEEEQGIDPNRAVDLTEAEAEVFAGLGALGILGLLDWRVFKWAVGGGIETTPPEPWDTPWVDHEGNLLARGAALDTVGAKIDLPEHKEPQPGTGGGGGGAAGGMAGGGGGGGGGRTGGGRGGGGGHAGTEGGATGAQGTGEGGALGDEMVEVMTEPTAGGDGAPAGSAGGPGGAPGEGKGERKGDGDGETSFSWEGDFDPIGGLAHLISDPAAAAEELVNMIEEAIDDPDKMLAAFERIANALTDPSTLLDALDYITDFDTLITAAALVGGFLVGYPGLFLPLADMLSDIADGKEVSVDMLTDMLLETGGAFAAGDPVEAFTDALKDELVERLGDALEDAGVDPDLIDGFETLLESGDSGDLIEAGTEAAEDFARDNLGELGDDIADGIDTAEKWIENPEGEAIKLGGDALAAAGVPEEAVHVAQLGAAIETGDIHSAAAAGAEVAKDLGVDPIVADAGRDLVTSLADGDLAGAGQAATTLAEKVFDMPHETAEALGDIFAALGSGDEAAIGLAIDRLAGAAGVPPEVSSELRGFGIEMARGHEAAAMEHIENLLVDLGIPEPLADFACDQFLELL